MGKELLSPRQVRLHISILLLILCGSVAAHMHSLLGLHQTSALQTFLLTFLSLNYILCGTTYRCLQLNVGK